MLSRRRPRSSATTPASRTGWSASAAAPSLSRRPDAGGRQHGPVRPLRSQDQHPRSRIYVGLRPSRALPQSPPFAYRLQPHPRHEHRPRTPILARSLGPLRTPARGTQDGPAPEEPGVPANRQDRVPGVPDAGRAAGIRRKGMVVALSQYRARGPCPSGAVDAGSGLPTSAPPSGGGRCRPGGRRRAAGFGSPQGLSRAPQQLLLLLRPAARCRCPMPPHPAGDLRQRRGRLHRGP